VKCFQEQCPNWAGDGDACPCALFDLTPPRPVEAPAPEEEVIFMGWMSLPESMQRAVDFYDGPEEPLKPVRMRPAPEDDDQESW
jgi:hypothetical protein